MIDHRRMMDITVAVATVDGRGVRAPFLSPPYLIVDQAGRPAADLPQTSGYVFMPERGLSRSRNKALELCRTPYLLFADDDVIHIPDGLGHIVDDFERTGADILTYAIRDPDGHPFKSYRSEPFRHDRRSLFRVNSIEIAVRVSAVRRAGLRFDERFGLGAEYPTGEEIVFLGDAFDAGLDLRFEPRPIVIHPRESSGGNLKNNDRLLLAKGAMFARSSRRLSAMYCAAFALKHCTGSGYTPWQFLRLMLQGRSGFLSAADSKRLGEA